MEHVNRQVDELARLVRWNGAGSDDVDWESVERSLGVPVPNDFKALVAKFPRGVFRKYASVSIPECSDGQWNFIGDLELALEDLRAWRDDEPDRFPYPLYPEKRGLIPWGGSTQGEIFFWAPDAEDPAHWDTVAYEPEEIRWERFHLSATEFLNAVIAGTLESTTLAGPRVAEPLFTSFAEVDTVPESRYSGDAGAGLFSEAPSNELESIIDMVGQRNAREVERILWDEVEHRLGFRLPSDYKACADHFGAGSFRDLQIAVPNCPILAFDLFSLIDDVRRRGQRSTAGSSFERLIPWGRTVDGLTFFWEIRDGSPDEWSVRMAQPDLGVHQLLAADQRRLSMTGVIARYLRDPLSIAPRLIDSRTETVVDPRDVTVPPGFSPAT